MSKPQPIEPWVRRLEAMPSEDLPPLPPAKPRPWVVLGVTPNMERRVAETLTEAGLEVYVPVETYLPNTANVARANKPWRPRTRPLIPGYLFVDLPDDAALDIARANRAVRLKCREGRPIAVPAMAVGTMILLEAFGAFDRTRKLTARRPNRRKRRGKGVAAFVPRWKSGERVKISPAGGVWAGFDAIVQADRGDRIEVLVSIFGRASLATLDEAMIGETLPDAFTQN